MREWSQEELDALIACPKVISDPPRKVRFLDRGSYRNDMKVTSEDGKQRFRIFMRENERFSENFSVGMDFLPIDEPGDLPLIRCNGQHERRLDVDADGKPHFAYHIHWVSAESLAAGEDPLTRARATREYGTFPDALRHLLKTTHIAGAEQYFPPYSQLSLLDGGGEGEDQP